MDTIPQSAAVANLPVSELDEELCEFVKPMLPQLPENRLAEMGCLALQGTIGAQSPIVTKIVGCAI